MREKLPNLRIKTHMIVNSGRVGKNKVNSGCIPDFPLAGKRGNRDKLGGIQGISPPAPLCLAKIPAGLFRRTIGLQFVGRTRKFETTF